jgi:hypothetical protein
MQNVKCKIQKVRKQKGMKRTARYAAILNLLLLLLFFYGFVTGACAEEPRQKGLTDLDFNDDGQINQLDLDILKSHFNERYKRYVPWDLNADFRCDHEDFYYFADHVPLDYRYPKEEGAVCVHYARDLCRLAYKSLGPKTIAWGTSNAHSYGMIYTGGNWSVLSNWAIIDPLWELYRFEEFSNTWSYHHTKTIKVLLEEN